MSRRKQARPKSCKNEDDVKSEDNLLTEEMDDVTDASNTANDGDGADLNASVSKSQENSTISHYQGDMSDEEMSPINPKVFRCESCDANFTNLNHFMDHRNYECLGDDDSSMMIVDYNMMDGCETSSVSSQSPVPPSNESMSPKPPGFTPENVPYSEGVDDSHPYACQYCEKAFARLGHLKIHEQTMSKPNRRGISKVKSLVPVPVLVKLNGEVWWPGYIEDGKIMFWGERYVMDPNIEDFKLFDKDSCLITKAIENLKKKKWLLKKYQKDLEIAESLVLKPVIEREEYQTGDNKGLKTAIESEEYQTGDNKDLKPVIEREEYQTEDNEGLKTANEREDPIEDDKVLKTAIESEDQFDNNEGLKTAIERKEYQTGDNEGLKTANEREEYQTEDNKGLKTAIETEEYQTEDNEGLKTANEREEYQTEDNGGLKTAIEREEYQTEDNEGLKTANEREDPIEDDKVLKTANESEDPIENNEGLKTASKREEYQTGDNKGLKTANESEEYQTGDIEGLKTANEREDHIENNGGLKTANESKEYQTEDNKGLETANEREDPIENNEGLKTAIESEEYQTEDNKGLKTANENEDPIENNEGLKWLLKKYQKDLEIAESLVLKTANESEEYQTEDNEGLKTAIESEEYQTGDNEGLKTANENEDPIENNEGLKWLLKKYQKDLDIAESLVLKTAIESEEYQTGDNKGLKTAIEREEYQTEDNEGLETANEREDPIENNEGLKTAIESEEYQTGDNEGLKTANESEDPIENNEGLKTAIEREDLIENNEGLKTANESEEYQTEDNEGLETANEREDPIENNEGLKTAIESEEYQTGDNEGLKTANESEDPIENNEGLKWLLKKYQKDLDIAESLVLKTAIEREDLIENNEGLKTANESEEYQTEDNEGLETANEREDPIENNEGLKTAIESEEYQTGDNEGLKTAIEREDPIENIEGLKTAIESEDQIENRRVKRGRGNNEGLETAIESEDQFDNRRVKRGRGNNEGLKTVIESEDQIENRRVKRGRGNNEGLKTAIESEDQIENRRVKRGRGNNEGLKTAIESEDQIENRRVKRGRGNNEGLETAIESEDQFDNRRVKRGRGNNEGLKTAIESEDQIENRRVKRGRGNNEGLKTANESKDQIENRRVKRGRGNNEGLKTAIESEDQIENRRVKRGRGNNEGLKTVIESEEDEIVDSEDDNDKDYVQDTDSSDYSDVIPRISDFLEDSNDSQTERKGRSRSKDIVRDTNIRGIFIKKYVLKKPREFRGQSKDTRIYDNHHACFICGKMVLHINEHLKTHRSNELMKNILVSDKPDFTNLRKMGDDKHNRECLENGEGEIILARRPTGRFDVTQYGPCPDCREWVLLTGIKSHNDKCSSSTQHAVKRRKKDLIVQSQIIAGHIQSKASSLMQSEVLTIMTNDDISRIAQEDPLIMALGESWLRRNISNKEKRKYYASARMRLCARLLKNLQNLYKSKVLPDEEEVDEEVKMLNAKSPVTMWDFLQPQFFDDVALCALKCSHPNADDIEDLAAPSNIIKLKYDLQRLVNSKWAFTVKSTGNESNQEAQGCRAFLHLMEVEWKEKALTLARAVLNRRKFEEIRELPSPEDIERITNFLSVKIKNLSLTPINYRRAVVLVQTKLLCFNKRRSGEIDQIKLQSYASRSSGLNDIDESLARDLSEVEKYLIETQDLMKVRGKRNRPVPVLIPGDCKRPLAFLADKNERKKAGIVEGNHYLFPNSVNYYARSYESLQKICSEIKLIAPHRITSVSMRKYTATLTQMFNLDKYQLEWVCNHLGHTSAVHRTHYRQMSGLIERTHISKLLLIQDLNLTANYKGKKLEDMDIRDIIFREDNIEKESTVLPEELSFEDEPLDFDEETYLKESEKQEEEEEEEEIEDEKKDKQTKQKTKNKRKRWTAAEVHADQLPFKCSHCNRLFRHKRSRDRHMKLHTGIKKFKCTECTSAFARSDHLKSHLKTHKNDKSTVCPVCHRTFQNTAALTSHMLSQHKPSSCSGGHKCLQCQKQFTNMHDLQTHILTHIKSEQFQCSYCGDSFTSQETLDLHIDTHLSDKKIKCPICFEELDNTEELLQHMEVHNESISHDDSYGSNQPSFPGSITDKRAGGSDILPVPGLPNGESSLDNLVCPYCMNGGFDTLEMLEIHMQSVHSVKSTEIYTCNYCNAPYPNLYSLHSHMNVVHSNQPCLDIKYPCSHCSEHFSSIDALCNHKKKHHNKSNNKEQGQENHCGPCATVFPDRKTLEEHNRNFHPLKLENGLGDQKLLDEKPIMGPFKDLRSDMKIATDRNGDKSQNTTCDHCNATFNDAHNYQSHMKLHMDSFLYSCHQCKQQFPTEEQLESHSAMHYLSLTTEYGCTSCMKLFTKPDELQKHLLDIHAHHLYRCSLCKEIFDSKVNIQVHFAIKHSNECKLYKCTQCQNIFRSEMEWQVHVRVNHLKMAKPYRCLFCKESFSNEMELQCHLTTHSKPFKCLMCDESFHIEYMLDQHMQATHGEMAFKAQAAETPVKIETKQKDPEHASPILSATLNRAWEHSSPSKTSPSHPAWTIPKTSPVSNQLSPNQTRWTTASPGRHTPWTSPSSSSAPPTAKTPPSSIWKNVEPLHICNICDMKFSEMSLLYLHKLQDHGLKTSKQAHLSSILLSPSDKLPALPPNLIPPTADKPTSSCTFCSQIFKNKNEYEKHMKIHINNGNLKCNICDEVFPTPDILGEHKLQHCKIQQGNACVICKLGLKTEEQFYVHSQEHGYQGSLLQCIVCRQSLASLMELQMHGKHHFQNKQNFSTCCVCLKSFDSKENLVSKLNSTGRTYYVCKPCYHGENAEYKCTKCNQKFASSSQLDIHMQTHQQQSFQCIKCQQSFNSEYEIQLHVATHMMQEGVIHDCKLCLNKFDSPAKLQCHLIEHTYENNSEIICCVCFKLFNSASEMQGHALEHGVSARKYPCRKCEQKFFFSAELENHCLTEGHSSSTDGLECPECHKIFSSNVNMMNHRRIHEKKENVIKCLLCKEMFTTVFAMQQHFFSSHSRGEIEKENKVFQCSECDQEFPCLSNLQGHLRSHKPGNQFPCPVCNKMFALARNLTIHMRSHSGEKPYECPICNKRFSRKENRKHHMKSHNSTKPFICPVCGKTFTRKCHIKEHMRVHYSQDSSMKFELSNIDLDLPSDTSEEASLNGFIASEDLSDIDENEQINGHDVHEDLAIPSKKIKVEPVS